MSIMIISIISYFLGNISASYLIAKYKGGIDIRKHGSGNAGATNVLRTLGAKAGLLAFAGDALKGILAVILGKLIGGEDGQIAAGIFVVIGHNWPILLGFKGGKGIATTIGVMIAINPYIVAAIVPIGLIIIFITKYVSLASILGMAIFPITMLMTKQPVKLVLFSFLLSAMAIYRHKSNIKKLIGGTEAKIGDKVKKY
ncbi:glycerol-3-phosphate 1-O-acyltransferase PlsY [Lutispora sp.]|uniref:glycerol-3-phosphate 1-O-acyltransferase PlsY n=1 Tax=Lutispora sp. TaxID=2828727 RepID=UPI000EE3D560|nr:glycerol-3-phosphate 1-O-acyltransferase PlsY [Lutispora sp.]MEA4962016.1 glycerol-3-phosphate 1-O-acyltransferase PlsY [Lutispora sp.]HCJ57752.1 acyl-phosphate glycerol 3-phosphate acyltransferase [Clostridiaceae bacterium]